MMVNLNPSQMYAAGLSAQDVTAAVNSMTVIIPAGSAKIGNYECRVELNGSPDRIDAFNNLPVKVVNGATVFLGEVAPVTDTHSVQTQIVRIDGKRSTYVPVFKHFAASTLSVVDQVLWMLPLIREPAPKGGTLGIAFHQSVFVRAALLGVVREAVIAAGLVAVRVVIFPGSAPNMPNGIL